MGLPGAVKGALPAPASSSISTRYSHSHPAVLMQGVDDPFTF